MKLFGKKVPSSLFIVSAIVIVVFNGYRLIAYNQIDWAANALVLGLMALVFIGSWIFKNNL